MPSLASVNGAISAPENARVSIWDRGFLFGDAVYEVMRIYRGRCWLEDEHFARLARSLGALEFPLYDLAGLRARVRDLIRESAIGEGTIYIQITRGSAPRTHAFPDPPVPPTEVLVVRPYDDAATAQLRETGVAAITQPDLRWKRRDIKTVNLLGNVLAMEHARRAGCYEAVLVDEHGYVTESTHTSLLWVHGQRVQGTPEGPEILPGTTRARTLRMIASVGADFEEARIQIDDLRGADELILVGTTSEVLSIVTLDGQPIANGKPGPVSRRLWDAYRGEVERWLGA